MKLDIRPLPGKVMAHRLPPEPGFYRCNEEVYFGLPGANASTLKVLQKKTAGHAHAAETKAFQESITPKQATAAQEFGTAFHCRLLEAERFDRTYIRADYTRTKKKKEEAAELDQRLLKADDYDKVTAMVRAAFTQSDQMRALYKKGQSEISMWWIDPHTGILCKGRLDWWSVIFDIPVDVKTAESALPFDFSKAIANYGYHISARHYLDGLQELLEMEINDFIWSVHEKEEPYQVALYRADKEMLDEAEIDLRQLKEEYRECLDKDEWPLYPGDLTDISLPGWVKRKKHRDAFDIPSP